MTTDSLLSLLWWIAIAVVFFWLMRRAGCGMMAHGAGRARSRDDEQRLDRCHSVSGKPLDPVCGMEIEPARAAGTRVVSGRTFFFCSQMCLDTFDKNPDLQTSIGHAGASHHHQHAGC